MRLLGFPLDGVPEPTATGYSVGLHKALLQLRTPYSPRNAQLCRMLPDHHMWDADTRSWLAKPTRRNLEFIRSTFPEAVWTSGATERWRSEVEAPAQDAAAMLARRSSVLGGDDAVTDYKPGGPAPWPHQRQGFMLSRDRKAFALLMQQRTGKSKVFIDTACWLYTRGAVEQALVVCPNSIKTVWTADELPMHMPSYIKYRAAYWSAAGGKDHQRQVAEVAEGEGDEMRWLVMNVESLSSERGVEAARRFLARRKTIMLVDESSRIKTPGANRTRAVIKLGKLAPYRRIASGTYITQGPLDAYAQFAFLDPAILGFGTYGAFRNHFAIMGGFNDKQVIGYAHLDELKALIEPHSFRVLRSDCVDLPPRLYSKIEVELAPEQRRLYNQMRDEMVAENEHSGTRISATIVLTQMLRLQQITGGFFPAERMSIAENGVLVTMDTKAEAIAGPNPKLDALVDYCGDLEGKAVIWARFRPEIDIIAKALRKAHGDDAVVEFHGGVKDAQRASARALFQDPDSSVRFFVGQTETGGLGIKLSAARTVIYYSNSFSLESRLQSEDRIEDMQRTESVAVVDIVARDTRDPKVLAILRGKETLAGRVTGDAWREWI